MGNAAHVTALAFVAIAIAACDMIPGTVEYKAKETIRATLSDPESARFRNVRAADETRVVVCGEVNGKNRFGGYVGYRGFIVGGDITIMQKDDLDAAFAESKAIFCP